MQHNGFLFCFQFTARDTALADYRSQSTRAKLIMIWNRHSSGATFNHMLHDNVATSLPNFLEAMSFQNRTNRLPRKNAKFTQLTPQRVSRKRHHQGDLQFQQVTHIRKTTPAPPEADRVRPECCFLDLRCPVPGRTPQNRHPRPV